MAARDAAGPRPDRDSHPTARRYIDVIVKAAETPSRNRTEEVKPSVEKLSSHHYDHGVLPADLDDLVEVLTTPNHLDQASLNAILKSLYPASPVSGSVLVKVVGALGHGRRKPSLAVQGALLRWLIMINHVVDSSGTLSQSYSLLFNLLDTAAIRTHVCHILALITRRRHVRPHRIQSLLSLARQTGNDQALTGLLRVYKNYYPEIVVGDAVRGKASAFAHPDTLWRDRLAEIQQAHAERIRKRSEQPLSAYQVARNNGKTAVPEVHSSRVTEQSVTLEEIDSADGLVDKLEKLEFPDQLVAVLGDPLLQKLFLLRPNAEATQRANQWLASYAEDVLNGEMDSGIFQTVQSYLSATKVMPPVVLAFLSDYMRIWDGREDRTVVLDILSFIPMLEFKDLLSTTFLPLEARLLDGTVDTQIVLLNFYRTLLRRWRIAVTLIVEDRTAGARKAAASIEALERRAGTLCLAILQSTSPSLVTPLASSGSTIAADAVLNFYEETASLAVTANSQNQQQQQQQPPNTFSPLSSLRITIPPKPVVYLLTFYPCTSVLSRLCGILAQYKTAFSYAQQRKLAKGGGPNKQQYPSAYVDEFNGFLMDMCNLIWRSRAFGQSDPNAHGCLLDEGVNAALAEYVREVSSEDDNVKLSLAALYSFSYSPLLCGLVASKLAELEDQEYAGSGQNGAEQEIRHAGPVTKATLRELAGRGGVNMSWEDFRVEVLEELTEVKGLGGIAELLYNTMTTLAGKKPSM